MTRCEWDEDKNEKNMRKHGISFEIAARIFENPYLDCEPSIKTAPLHQNDSAS